MGFWGNFLGLQKSIRDVTVLAFLMSTACLCAQDTDLELPGADLLLLEGQYFEIVCAERVAGLAFLREAEAFGRRATGIFREQAGEAFLPIRVQFPLESVDVPETWTVSWGNANQVVLQLGMNTQASDRSTLEGVAAAWLMQEAFMAGGASVVESIPEWLIPALALDDMQSRHPGAHAAWAEIARYEQAILLDDLQGLSYANIQDSWPLACQAWLLYDRLMALGTSRSEKVFIARSLLAGRSPELFIARKIFDTDSAPQSYAELWWMTEWDAYLWSGEQRILPIDLSRAELERLAYWSLSIDDAVMWADASIFLRESKLWTPDLIEAMEKRVAVIKRTFTQINPAYANALHSLGIYYEALLLERYEDAAEAWERFAADIRSGQEIWQTIRNAEIAR